MNKYSPTVDKAREYYNSSDADIFYMMTWGGEDIHIGLYESPNDSVYTASRRTVRYMAQVLKSLAPPPNLKILDIGSGYGGASRFLASNFNAQVTALNLSDKQNAHHRAVNKEQSLEKQIEVIDGNFEEIPFPGESFDLVWSQDAILHSGNRARVVKEVARVLKPGGHFLFTDIMQANDCPEGSLQPILDRIHLASLGSPAFYQHSASEHDLIQVQVHDKTRHLILHYDAIHHELEQQEEVLKTKISDSYIQNMKTGLRRWVEGGKKGHLVWGILVFKKKIKPLVAQ